MKKSDYIKYILDKAIVAAVTTLTSIIVADIYYRFTDYIKFKSKKQIGFKIEKYY